MNVTVERAEWGNDLWLEVAPEHRAEFTDDLVERIRVVCEEVSNRRCYGITEVGVREVLPDV